MTGATGPLLAIDSGSPRVSVAIGGADGVLADASESRDRSSSALLGMIERVLEAGGLAPGELAGLIALRGPGSFTGLRVGMATVLGLHQALGLPAVGVPTLDILAGLGPADGSTIVAAVDALRGDWFAQPFRSGEPPHALAGPRLVPASELPELGPSLVVGFGVTDIAALAEAGIRGLEPPPLAGVAAHQLSRSPVAWEPASLVEPLYLRPPSASPPTGRVRP